MKLINGDYALINIYPEDIIYILEKALLHAMLVKSIKSGSSLMIYAFSNNKLLWDCSQFFVQESLNRYLFLTKRLRITSNMLWLQRDKLQMDEIQPALCQAQ